MSDTQDRDSMIAAIHDESTAARADVNARLERDVPKKGTTPTAVATGDLPLPGSSRTTVSVSRKVPGMPFEVMQAKTQRFQESNQHIRDLLDAAAGERQKNHADLLQAITNEGEAKVGVVNTAGAREIEKVAAQQAAVARFHVNTEDQVVIDAQRRRAESQNTMDTLRPRIEEESAVTIFDDPLRWAINQFTLPTLKQTYNAASRQDQAMAKRIAANAELARATQAVDTGATVQAVNAEIAAKAHLFAAEATRVARQAIDANAANVAQSLAVQAHLNGSDMAADQALARMFAETQGISMAEKRDAEIQAKVDKINLIRAQMGLTIPMTVFDFTNLRADEREMWIKQTLLPAGKLGSGPGSAYGLLLDSGAIDFITEKNKPVATVLQTAMTSDAFTTAMAARMSKDTKFAALPERERDIILLNDIAESQLVELKKKGNYDKADKTSPYWLKIGNSIQYPELANNMFAKDVKVLLEAGGFRSEVTAKQLELSAVGKVIADPQSASKVAKELSDFYRIAQLQQWGLSGASQVGYPRPSEFKTTTMTIAGKPANQWNPVEIEHWLTTQLLKHRLNSTVAGSSDSIYMPGVAETLNMPNTLLEQSK